MGKRLSIGVILAFGFLSGCGGWQLVAHTPNMLDPSDDLPKQLKRMIEEQRGGAPLNLVVTEEKISGDVVMATQYQASATNYVIYFDRIESIELYQKKDTFSILIKDKNGKNLMRLLTKDPEEAKHMVDVIATLTQRAKAKVG